MKSYEILLQDNKAWAKKRVENDPNFFKHLSELQNLNFYG